MGHKVTYDASLRATPHGSRLYQRWRRIRKCDHAPEFEHFPDFHDWAMGAGYQVGDKLRLANDTKPYSPDNCYFEAPKYGAIKWNDSVDAFRKQCGLPPLKKG